MRPRHTLIRLPTLEANEALCLMCGLPMPITKEESLCDPEAIQAAGLRLEAHWPSPRTYHTCRECGAVATLDNRNVCARCSPTAL